MRPCFLYTDPAWYKYVPVIYCIAATMTGLSHICMEKNKVLVFNDIFTYSRTNRQQTIVMGNVVVLAARNSHRKWKWEKNDGTVFSCDRVAVFYRILFCIRHFVLMRMEWNGTREKRMSPKFIECQWHQICAQINMNKYMKCDLLDTLSITRPTRTRENHAQ